MKYKVLWLYWMCFLHVGTSFAQDSLSKRPKIGLCLSGGGAKGIAHISLLKAIDSLGIQIDAIAGTSMGSIIGGLYAIGYSGKELERIMTAADWDVILSNSTPLTNISIEEKQEYDRYMLNMPLQNGKLELPTGIIEGQNILNLLKKFTFPVAHIKDFNQLPIPFKCVAANIVRGEGIIIDKGDLALAMRTSMSIPTVFTPVHWGRDTLMVDGGLVRNFPADVLKGMGADVVIGAYTGGKLYSEAELNSFIRILYQSSSFQRLNDSELQKKLCNILVDYDKALVEANINVSDFRQTKKILAISSKVVQQSLPALQALANAQRRFFTAKNHVFISKNTVFKVKSIDFISLPPSKKQWALHKLDVPLDAPLSHDIILEGINRLYGTNGFKRIFYEILGTPDSAQLLIHVAEQPQIAIKGGLHYDNELSSAITIGLTARDLLSDNTIVSAVVDVSENPKTRINYRQHFGKTNWTLNFDQWYEENNDYLFFDNQRLDNYRRRQHQINGYLGRSFGQNLLVGIGGNWTLTRYNPRYYIDDKIYINQTRPDSLSQLTRAFTNILGINAFLRFNTFNMSVFPTHGVFFVVDAKYGFLNYVDYETTTVYAKRKAKQDSVVTNEFIDTKVAPFLKITTCLDIAIPINKIFCLRTTFRGGSIWGDNFTKSGNLYGENFLLGGVESRRSTNYIPFAGNREGDTQHTAFATAQIGLQAEIIDDFFVMPHSALLWSGTAGVPLAYSYGLTVGCRTTVAPVSFTIANATNEQRWQPYFSIGYRF
jgi:NTE family protein